MLCAPRQDSVIRKLRFGRPNFQKFAESETGSLTIFTLFIFIVILMVTGMAVDLMRFESRRVALQSTLDRAVLAAADMDQTMDADTIIQDFVAKSGLSGAEVRTRVSSDATFRSVEAQGRMRMGTIFMPLFGINDLAAPAEGGATEGMTEIEISLVLDVSGSMGRNSRLTNLKVAAKEFIDTVLVDPANGGAVDTTHISIVPFSNQVNGGSQLASNMNYSGEHNVSYCVDWTTADYAKTGVDPLVPVPQTSHFENGSNRSTSSSFSPVCRTESHRQILAYQNNRTTLKTFIENLQSGGWTSVELGAKWGSLLLDPSMQGTVTGMIADTAVPAAFEGRPLDYTSRNNMKIMILMSDGANTRHWEINPGFKSGPSPFWYDADKDVWSYDDSDQNYGGSASRPFWFDDDGDEGWASAAFGTNPQQQTWQQVWAFAGVQWFRDNIIDKMSNSNSDGNTWYANVVTEYNLDTDTTKDDRSAAICKAARDQGVTVYAIGFETDANGDRALLNCATSISHFYNAQGTQISDVFASIASDITQLKLTY